MLKTVICWNSEESNIFISYKICHVLLWKFPVAEVLKIATLKNHSERMRTQISSKIVSTYFCQTLAPLLPLPWHELPHLLFAQTLKELCDENQGARHRFDGNCRCLGLLGSTPATDLLRVFETEFSPTGSQLPLSDITQILFSHRGLRFLES